MRRLGLLTAVLGLLATTAQAWPAHLAVSVPSAQFAGDIQPGAYGFWGTRVYLASQAGDGTTKVVRLERASDSQVCDFVSNASGGVGNSVTTASGCSSGVSVATFLSATTGRAVTLYDMSGNGRDMSIGYSAAPTFTQNCINTSLPCLTFAGAQYLAAGSFSVVNPLTAVVVADRTASTPQGRLISDNGGNNYFGWFAANTAGGYMGNVASATASDNAWHVLQYENTGSSTSAIVVDSATTGSLNFGSGTVSGLTIMGASDTVPDDAFVGMITEVGLWSNSAFPSAAYNTNAHAYYGF